MLLPPATAGLGLATPRRLPIAGHGEYQFFPPATKLLFGRTDVVEGEAAPGLAAASPSQPDKSIHPCGWGAAEEDVPKPCPHWAAL